MDAFDKISARTSPLVKKRVSRNLAIAERIYEILEEKKMKQKDLAKLMKKQPSEISKWLTGLHNFELKTIDAIEVALGCDIITVAQPEVHIVKTVHVSEPKIDSWRKKSKAQTINVVIPGNSKGSIRSMNISSVWTKGTN